MFYYTTLYVSSEYEALKTLLNEGFSTEWLIITPPEREYDEDGIEELLENASDGCDVVYF